MTGTWEAEAAVSQDHTTALQPGDQARLCLKENKKAKGKNYSVQITDTELLSLKSPASSLRLP